jgi:beta-glucanase (GH16 family)
MSSKLFSIKNKYFLLSLGVLVVTLAVIITFMSRQSNALPAIKGYSWSMVFDDEFNSDTLDNSKWVTCYDWYSKQYDGCSNNGNHELEWYMSSQVSVQNGYVSLNAISKPVNGWNGSSEQNYPYRSGMISTGRADWNGVPKSTYTYGYFVARMRTTSGKGVWPAFWLLPADHSWPPEIDAMEILGDKPNNVLMTYHWGNSSSPQKDGSIYTNLDNPNAWHTYAINWQPGYIDWYIDGVLRKHVTGTNVPRKPMEIIANLAIGGDLPGNPNSTTPFPASLQIDYIRVYKAVQK